MLHDVVYPTGNILTQLQLLSQSILMDGNWMWINHPIFPIKTIRLGIISHCVRKLLRSYITICMWYHQREFEKVSYCSLMQWISLVQWVYTWKCVLVFIPLSSHDFVSNNQYGHRDILFLSQLVFTYIIFIMLHYFPCSFQFHHKYINKQSNHGMHYSR